MKIDRETSARNEQESQPSLLRMVAHHNPVDLTMPRKSEASSRGYIFTDRDLLCIEHLAELPLDSCIKTNRPAQKVVQINLRNPLQPSTWWGESPRQIEVGLTREQYHLHCLNSCAAKLSVVLAPVALWFGVMNNPWFCVVAFFLFIAASLLNAISPVYFRRTSAEFTSICGTSAAFRAQFSQFKGQNYVSTAEVCQVSTPHSGAV